MGVSGVLVEAVPNFSEGRDRRVIEALVRAARVPGAQVLDFSADADHNRSVLTLAGEASAVVEALYRAALVAVEQIDLTRHRGTHPRIGAVDVIPLVPLGNTAMADCVGMAVGLGERLGQAGLPVYLYAEAARRPERRRLADVRRGQFEGLRQAMARPEGRPDFGPPHPHPTAGAVAVGARPPLIAFNVYLATRDLDVGRAVARAVRASSGGLPAVQALGMWIASRGQVQVSMNLVDFRQTGMAAVLRRVREEAACYGVAVTEAEIVGLVPAAALEEHLLRDAAFSRDPREASLEGRLARAGLAIEAKPGR